MRSVWRVAVAAMIVVGAAGIGRWAAAPDATPESFGDLPVGITLEHLAATPSLPFAPAGTSAAATRYRYEPGAEMDLRFPGPVLVAVETGTLALEAVGPAVSIRHAAETTVVGTASAGRDVRVRAEGKAPAAGAPAVVAEGGSAYAADGDLGASRNAGSEPLVVLVVAFVTQPEAVEATVMAPLGNATPSQTPTP